ncbi:adenomatous polyposis coli protein isoform X3 [Neodiprion lecontei]|uniref:Adenomatous polyposis coli protein isoform X3 n=1 Tax=Neodiprion lecontei TaxID=441921 RepID=A0ABM3G0H7_NEOLC|nr:adenomatous polyposis coli protein isoform X3 [Neodiprion lecontei]
MEPKLKEDEGIEAREKIQERKKMNGKMDEVYDLLEMLRGIEGCKDINAFLLSMSSAIDICLAMKQSGCLPLLIKLINARGHDTEAKEITSQVFHNIIQATADRSTEQPETRIYNLLEQLKDYCQMLRSIPETEHSPPEDVNDQPVDYSQKYSEPNPVVQNKIPCNSNNQPIDYSMKYYENNSLNQDDVSNDGKVQGTVDYGKRFSEPTCTLHQNSPQNDEQVQPIKYSTRYSEKNSMLQPSDVADETETIRIPKKENSDSSSKPDVFGVYAETDLDQPTDYSLRYAEDDTDEEEKQNSGYFAENEQAFVPEDTIKTYCTEGTPYETPFNFSTATSMSDLRVDDSKDTDVSKKNPMKIVENNSKDNESTFEPSPEESNGQIVANNESESRKNVSERSSDQVSPEKSDKYCEEVVDKEGKMVTFGGEDHYAEETPLMFSRTSSLGSLGGFEQHSIHDDRSSVVSDFSWRTSGIVSPSELPDSPTQTVPPSPRHNKSQPEFTNRSQDETSKLPAHRLCEHKANGRSNATKRSVFEDDIAAFKEESTPIDFSAATSLSSLTIDDEPKIANDSKFKENREKLGEAIPEEREETSPTRLEHQDTIKIAEIDEVSEGEDDEGMLDACINIGMQSIINRKDEQKPSVNSDEIADIVETVDTDQETDGDEDDDMLAACISIGMHSTFRNRKEDQKGSESSDIASVAEVVDVGEISDEHDDDEGMLAACINIGIQRAINRQEDPKTILKPEIANSVEAEDSLKISDVDSDGEEMLAACINVGIQSIHKQSLRRSSMTKPPIQPVSNLTRYQTSSALNHLDGGLTTFPGNHRQTLKGLKGRPDDTAIPDSIHIYCTEDTPANISPAGSHSNLSVLSMLSSPGIVEKSCEPRIMESNAGRSDILAIDSLTLSEEDDVIVAKLIESGMRKVQLNGNPACGITLPVSSKSDQERPCRTPSTSPAEPVFIKPKKDSPNSNDTGPLRSQSPEDGRRYEATTFATLDMESRNCKSLDITPVSTELKCSKHDFDTE